MIDELGQLSLPRRLPDGEALAAASTIAVNLSPLQFRAPRFAATLRAIADAGGRRAQPARAGDHRGPVHRAWHALRPDHPGAAPRRLPHRARRFRHRLFVAVLPAQIPGRQDQAGPLVHRHRRARSERRDHPRRGDARPCHGPRGHRRGHFQHATRSRSRSRPAATALQGHLYAPAMPVAELAAYLAALDPLVEHLRRRLSRRGLAPAAPFTRLAPRTASGSRG